MSPIVDFVPVTGVIFPSNPDNGRIFQVYRDGQYFGDVYRSMAARFPGYENCTDAHLVLSIDGIQFSCYVAEAQVATFIENFARLELAPF